MLNSGRAAAYRSRGEPSGGWRPAIDVFEADDVLNVVVELAGVREDQISVALDENIVRVRGERAPVSSDPNRSVHEIGIQYGPFAADIFLPMASIMNASTRSTKMECCIFDFAGMLRRR